MKIQILYILSSSLNTAKNANVNSIYLLPIYKYANNAIMVFNSIVKHQRIPGEI